MVEPKHAFPLVVAGPSGVGKTTLARMAVGREEGLRFSISDTSRPIRGGETEGEDYRFIGEEEFRRRVDEDAYAEWAVVHGDYYGTPRSEIERGVAAGSVVVLDIDVQGSAQIRERYDDSVGIFVVPPSLEVLERRLRGRKTEAEERIQRRLADAAEEMKCKFDYDYIVVNDDLEIALATVLSIVRAERWRAKRLQEIHAP
jgi:guanylate kinase